MYKENPKIFQIIKGEYRYLSFVRTITTKQDRHPNAGIVVLKETEIIKELEKTGKSNYRFLTPRETFLLMGFTEDDFEKVTVFNKRKEILYRQAGNSIAVNVLVALFNNMMKERIKIMKSGSAWNIATNFNSYIKDYIKTSCFKKGDILNFSLTPSGKELKVKVNKKDTNIIKKGDRSTFLQILSVWCTLGFIKLKNAEFIEKLDTFLNMILLLNIVLTKI